MAAALVAAPAAAHGSAPSTTTARAAATEQVSDAVRNLVNVQRAQHGLPPLRESGRLDAAAARHSADMVRRNYFEHVSPEGRTLADRVKRTGYLSGVRDWALGEDIGWGTGSLATPAAIVQSWMNSPPHRAVILSRRFREAGVGIAHGVPTGAAAGGATFTLDAGVTR